MGNALYAATQWLQVIALVRLGGVEDLGRFALALGIATPIFLLFGANLRVVIATDANRDYAWPEYIAARVGAYSAAALIAVLVGYAVNVPGLLVPLVLIVVLRFIEGLSDICYGRLQRVERLDLVGYSLAARGLSSLVAFVAGYYWTRSLAIALLGTCATWLVVLVVYDWRSASRIDGESAARIRDLMSPRVLRLLRRATPLGVAAVLDSLVVNVPRYFVEAIHGLGALGAFAALSYLMIIGGTFVSAMGSAIIPRLAQNFVSDPKRFSRIGYSTVAVGAAIGVLGIVVVVMIGGPVLRFIYGKELSNFQTELIWTMVAACFWYVAGLLGCMLNASGRFKEHLKVHLAMFVVCIGACLYFVPSYSVLGACIALAIAMGVRAVGAGWYVARLKRA